MSIIDYVFRMMHAAWWTKNWKYCTNLTLE